MFDAKIRARNESVFNGLRSQNPATREKTASDVNDYLRIRAREDGFARRIQPPQGVTPADFDRQVDTVKPVIVKDVEPNTPSAYSVPFGNVPMNHYMDAPRYRVMFDRLFSWRFIADIMDLLTYDIDIRQIFNDLMLKDLLGEEDRKYMAVVTAIVGDPANDATQVAHYNEVGARGAIFVGSLTQRKQLTDAMKGIPSTNRHLSPAVGLVNNLFIWDVVALSRDEVGGDLAEELFQNGFAERVIMGLQWFITIKTDLVDDTSLYMFAAPKFLGDFYTIEDVTVSTKNENFMFEMFATEVIGATIKNNAGVALAKFEGSAGSWRAAPVLTSSSSSSAVASSSSAVVSSSSSSTP